MIEVLVFSAALVGAVLVTAGRVIAFRRLLGYATAVDVVFSIMVFGAFGGSFTGLMVATVAGLMMALLLSFLRSVLGYERLVMYRERGSLTPRMVWAKRAPSHRFRFPKFRVVVE